MQCVITLRVKKSKPVVLAIDPERERISLGIKQLDQDPMSSYLSEHPKGSIVKGIVKEVDAAWRDHVELG